MPEAFIPIALSLLAAFFFALGAQFQNQGLPYMDSRTGATITISTAALIYILAAPFFLNVNNLFHPAVLIFILVGVFRPALSGNLALAGMRFLGPTIATTLTATSPLFGTAVGIFWLGEALELSRKRAPDEALVVEAFREHQRFFLCLYLILV